jgi:hypothetical protein
MAKPTKKPGKTASKFVTRAELARQAGVARSTATRACRGPLSEACQGDLVDLHHDLTRAWLAGERQPTAPAATDLTGEIANLNRRKKAAETAMLEMRSEALAGKLISAELVRKLVISHYEALHLRLLTDGPARMKSRFGPEVGEAIRAWVSTELAIAVRATTAGIKHSRVENGKPLPVAENEARDPDRERHVAVRAMAAACVARLEGAAAATIVDVVAKALARSAAGEPFSMELFEAALAAAQPELEDATRAAAAIMRHHVEEATRLTTESTTTHAEEN